MTTVQASDWQPAPLLTIGRLGWDVLAGDRGAMRHYGGAPLHFAVGAALADAHPLLLSAVDPRAWESALTDLTALGVNTRHLLHIHDMPSFHLHYASDSSLDMSRFRITPAASEPSPAELTDAFDRIASTATPGWVHICPHEPTVVATMMSRACELSKYRSLQFHASQLLHDIEVCRAAAASATHIFLNDTEFALITGGGDHATADAKARAISEATWFVTSPTGCAVITSAGRLSFAAMSAPAVDPTGAGDAFAGGVVAGLQRHLPLAKAVQIGLVSALINVTAPGSANGLRLSQARSGRPERVQQWSDSATLITGVKRSLAEFGEVRGWQNRHSTKTLVEALVVEASELLEQFLWHTGAEADDVSHNDRELIEDELADVFIYGFNLCNYMRIDALHAIQRKLAKNARKYPPVINTFFSGAHDVVSDSYVERTRDSTEG